MPPPPPTPRDGRAERWAGQRERRRRDFVDAALRAITRHGPDVSTEQIAAEAGVARTRLYRHFADATDLHQAIASHAVNLVTTELAQLWNLRGTPMQMIRTAIDAHITWLSANRHLYRYLSMHSLTSTAGGRSAAADVKTTIGRYLTDLFEQFNKAFEMDTRAAEPLAFALVGLVDSSTTQWLEHPGDLDHPEFSALLTRWVWRLLAETLLTNGLTLDPDAPLALPEVPFPGPPPQNT
ncbi:TetR/AcrR family transcriptional regulator [Amycolatopsis sp. GM8]|uniref:TetR/AcrR family transcriptional regulator n=1 Tax=Amycolatopsis sp. GM8 TaxID=2896530 RepID=UPI001F2FB634|nr:TetR/AcrR family transcriptional regulator [Amycolatopsis sp. GM8]